MAVKTTGELPEVKVGELPAAPDIYDDFKMPGEMQGEAVHVTGAQLKGYAAAAVSPLADAAAASAAAAGADAAAAKASAATAEGAKAAAQSALAGVQKALDNLPEGDTLVINDLTTGGAAAALSAEMGKTLGQGKVNKSGDTMAGILMFQSADNGYGRVNKSHSATADYGMILRDNDKDGNYLSLVVRAASRSVNVADSNGTAYAVLHTGNKPSGSYAGSSDTASRTIETGGLGNVCLIYSGYDSIALVSHQGAIFKTGAAVSALSASAISFKNGILTIATANTAVNGNANYFYQVL